MKFALCGILTLGIWISLAPSPAWGCGMGVPSPLARFTLAECVVVGRVTGYAEKSISTLPVPESKEKQEYAIVIVEIAQSLKGAEGLTHLQIGLKPRESIPVGQVACFFLNPHFAEPFYMMPPRFGLPILRDNNPGFEMEIRQMEHWGKLLQNPSASLQSDNADDRYLTAALLIYQYRTFTPGVHIAGGKTALIDSAESKMILKVLAEADWAKKSQDAEIAPSTLFARLNLTTKDGWHPKAVKSTGDFVGQAKKWLNDNAQTYHISAYIRI